MTPSPAVRAAVLPASIALRIPGPILVVSATLLVAVVGFQFIRDVPLLLDEERHFARIESIRDGTELRTIPACVPHTYHAAIAGLSRFVGIESEDDTRLLSLLLGLLCVPTAWSIVRALDREGAATATAQFLFLPTVVPFFFLLYTDVPSLLFVLLAVRLALAERLTPAAVAAIAAVLIRQTHVVWMGFAFALPYLRANGLALNVALIRDHLRRSWLFVLGFLGFGVFVLLNKGVALGDSAHHPAFEFRAGNVFFALFVVFVVFLPLHVANLPRIGRAIRSRPWWLLVVAAAFALFWFATEFDHPYNDWNYCLRNKVLNLTEVNSAFRGLFFVACAAALLSLGVTELRETNFTLLYPVAVLSLAPSWLVDPRYAIPALSLFVLFRARRSEPLERTSLAWSALLSVFVLAGTFGQSFFL